MRRRSAVAAALLAGVVVVGAGCGGGSDDARSAPAGGPARERVPDGTTPTSAPGASDPDPATPAAFAFSAPALGGGRVTGADYADTGVALWFWAPW